MASFHMLIQILFLEIIKKMKNKILSVCLDIVYLFTLKNEE